MVNFECPRCGYNADHKSHIIVHIERKKICKATINDISLEEYREYILDRTFSKVYPIIKENEQLKQKNMELEKELKEIKTAMTTKMGNNNVLGNNNIVLNITLTPYNDPNLENVEKYYKEAIKKVFMSVPTLIERIHFNEKMPENHNILMSNFRSKVLKVFNGKKWETMDENKLIEELIDANEKALEDWADNNEDRMKYIKKYRDIKERDGPEKVNNDLKTEVKKVLYDNRKMIKIKN